MSRNQQMIGVPIETAARIRAIAEAKKYDSVHDLLAAFVRSEIEKGTIPRGIPGITVDVEKDEVHISAREFTLAIQRQLAGRFAETLRKAAKTGGKHSIAGLSIKRTGKSGLKIEQPDTKAFLGLSDSTATELADLVAEKAATA